MADRKRLDRILDVMYAKIQKTLFPRYPERRPRFETGSYGNVGGRERILDGTGVSTNDVLSEAFLALLEYPPGRLKTTWEALAVGIAHNKAVDAIRASRRGLRETDHRPELRLVSGDAERESSEGETRSGLFEVLRSDRGDPEAEFLALQAVTELRDLARAVLDERGQEVYFAIHFDGYTRREVGIRFGLTGQRIGQIYNAAQSRLESHPHYPYELDN